MIVSAFLCELYDSNTFDNLDRFILILSHLCRFFGWIFMISIILCSVLLPIIISFVIKVLIEIYDSSILMYVFILRVVFMLLSSMFLIILFLLSNPSSVEKFNKELSPYALSYEHDFASDIYDKINDIYLDFDSIIHMSSIFVFILISEILLYNKTHGSVFSFLQSISGVIFLVYFIIKASNINFDINVEVSIDPRLHESYSKELDEIIEKPDEMNIVKWFLLNALIYLLFSFMHILFYYIRSQKIGNELIDKYGELSISSMSHRNVSEGSRKKEIIESLGEIVKNGAIDKLHNYKHDINNKEIDKYIKELNKLIEEIEFIWPTNIRNEVGSTIKDYVAYYRGMRVRIFLSLFATNSIGIIGMIYIWARYNYTINNFTLKMTYLVQTYDVFSSVVRKSWELENIKSFDRIDNIELYIRKYMYINIPREILKDNELSQFAVRFDLLLCSGDISGAEEYLNKCPSEELKLFLKKEIQDRENLLLNHVGISFQKMCNSFAIKEVDGNKEEYVSLVSNRGRITVLSGESGSGKSTINNSIMGDNRFLSSFINGYSSYLLDAPTKKLIPCYSDLFGIDVNNMSLIKNMKIFDRDTNVKELQYLWSYIGIQKYLYKLNREMSVIHFSKGQRDRMKISKIFVSLNSILKKATDTDAILNKRLLNALTSDVSDSELSDISDKIQCSSFMVVLDEPLGALDSGSAIKAMEIVRRYSKLGFSFLIIDHSGIASRYADDIIKIDNKTCEYYTRVNDTMVNIKDLNFENRDTLVIGDTIAYKHKCDKPLEVNKIRQLYKDKQFNSVEICKIDTKTKANLLSILNEHHKNEDKSEVSTNVSDLSDRVNDFNDDGNAIQIYE